MDACGRRLVYVVIEACITDSVWGGYTRAGAESQCTPVLNSESTNAEAR